MKQVVAPWKCKSFVNWMLVCVLISTLYGWRISLCEIHVTILIKYSWDFSSFKWPKRFTPEQRHYGIWSSKVEGTILRKIETYQHSANNWVAKPMIEHMRKGIVKGWKWCNSQRLNQVAMLTFTYTTISQ